MAKIRVCDFECTGLGPESLVCEHGFCDVIGSGDGHWEIGAHGSSLHEVETMPPDTRAIHHISAADTYGHPPFDPEEMWAQAKTDGVDVIAAHYASFDSQFWGAQQLPVICTFKVARQLWTREAPSHSNGALRYWLEDRGVIKPDPDLCYPPHRAGPDAYITANVLIAMLRIVPAKQMVAWTKLPVLMAVCPIGEKQGWRGKPWREVDAGFLRWIIDNIGDDPDVVWNAQQELQRREVVI